MSTAFGQCAVQSATLRGVNALLVTVEVVVCSGLPGMAVVGMADTAVQEARERVRAAVRAAGFSMPGEKIVVNLAPANLKKGGSGFDLPIALGILVATGQIDPAIIKDRLFVGELSLEGRVRPVLGNLAFGICAYEHGLSLVCGASSDWVPLDGLEQYALRDLAALGSRDLAGMEDEGSSRWFTPLTCPSDEDREPPTRLDFADIAGQEVAKRALQVAAAGNHGVLMVGPPGSGKTMLASRLPTILPPLNQQDRLASAVIHSVAGESVAESLAGRPPFRHPHHSASTVGLVGGGNPIRPGEISLAHKGVLFLDELAEFKPSTLQALRQPIESGNVVITRADGSVALPASFMLVAATNPCPCGYYGDEEHACSCTDLQVRRYQSRIGGPLLDRIDIHIAVKRLSATSVMKGGAGLSSQALLDGVLTAREFRRWRETKGVGMQSRPRDTTEAVVQACALDGADVSYVEAMAESFALSARSLVKVLSVARTIADMERSVKVERSHLSESLGFRLKDFGGI